MPYRRCVCFNPRARAGRDVVGGVLFYTDTTGFNPRARAGRDQGSVTSPPRAARFNPRARAGRDSCRGDGGPDLDVSIHAPARGATFGKTALSPTAGRFNPRARAGRDDAGITGAPFSSKFQSTRPRGARLFTSQLYSRRIVRVRQTRGPCLGAPLAAATGSRGFAICLTRKDFTVPRTAWYPVSAPGSRGSKRLIVPRNAAMTSDPRLSTDARWRSRATAPICRQQAHGGGGGLPPFHT